MQVSSDTFQDKVKRVLQLATCNLLLLITACGFTPMYGSQTGTQSGLSAAQGLDQVSIDIIPNASGVALRNHLIDRFYAGGYPASPRYRLAISPIGERIVNFDITAEDETTSRQVQLSTDIALRDEQTGDIVLKRRVQAYASYNVIGSQFTTRVSEADAREAALRDMAQQIETQIALYFNR
jgi:LPS-assembly lipoprotein